MSASDGGAPLILLFRRDLRLTDNPSVAAAAETGRPVIPLYVLDENPSERTLGGASRWWLDKSLRALGASLEARGSRLVLARGPLAEVVSDLVRHARAGELVFSRIHEPPTAEAEAEMTRRLQGTGVKVRSFNASLINQPGTVLNGQCRSYQVFGAYWRAARPRLESPSARPAPQGAEGAGAMAEVGSPGRLEPASAGAGLVGRLRGLDPWRSRRAGAAGGVRPPRAGRLCHAP